MVINRDYLLFDLDSAVGIPKILDKSHCNGIREGLKSKSDEVLRF